MQTKFKTTVTFTTISLDQAQLLNEFIKSLQGGHACMFCGNRLKLISDIRKTIKEHDGKPSLLDIKRVVFDHVQSL